MKLIAVFLIVFLLFSTVMISGCVSTGNEIKSQEDVSKALNNVSTDVEDIESKLNDIDQGLG